MTSDDVWECTEACYAMPRCTVCGLTKPPRGRSVALEMANGMCDRDCPGYYQEPLSGHLWPGEKGHTVSNEGDDEQGGGA